MTVLDKIKIEVETPSSGLPNLVRNPSGLRGGWGWVTPNANSTITAAYTGSVRSALILSTSVSQAVPAYSEAYPISVGEWASGLLLINGGLSPQITATHNVKIRVQFLASDKTTVLASGTQSAAWSGPGAVWTPAAQAPILTAYVRFRMDLYKGSGNADAGASVVFKNVMLTRSATNPGTSFPYAEPITWTDVTGKNVAITTDAPALEPGLVDGAITDPTYDFGAAHALAPGRAVRLSGWDGSAWQQFYEGNLGSPISTYDPEFKVSFEGTDAITRLAGITKVYGVGTINELPYILEGQGVAWDCGTVGGNQVASANYPVARNDNATLLDQVTIVRDSDNGFAWVDRFNVLTVKQRSSMSTTPIASLSDASGATYSYSAIEIDKGNTDSIINSIRVVWLRKTASGKTKEINYGPYVDQASVDAYGPKEVTFTLQGVTESTSAIAAWAAAILTANSTPITRAYTVSIPVRTDVERALVCTARHYDVLRITKGSVLTNVDHRITGIKHEITPDADLYGQHKWVTTFTLVPSSTVPPPTPPRTRAANARSAATPLSGDPTDGQWQAPALLNSWANQGSPWSTAGYQLSDDITYLQGNIQSGALNTNVFVLPAGCRPSTQKRFAVPGSGGTYAQVHVFPTGNVQVAAGSPTTYICLDGISFPADQ